MGKYEETAEGDAPFQDSHKAMMDVFSKIAAGRATQQDRERYLAMWGRETAGAGRQAICSDA